MGAMSAERRNLQDGWTTEMIILTACLGLGGFMLGALISHGTLHVDPFHSDVDCRCRRLALQNKVAEASRRLLDSATDSQELTSGHEFSVDMGEFGHDHSNPDKLSLWRSGHGYGVHGELFTS